jgi:MarR family transcriptional regulator, negative regulator of the multidrug operon emrRAB
VPIADIMLFRTLVLLGRALAQLADEGMRPSGLGEAEFRVLMMLYSQPDGVGHPGELCPGSGQSPANMSRITDTLVALDMITRVPSAEDRRRMVLRVTARGEAFAREFVPAAFTPVRKLFASLSDTARTQLLTSLGEIAAAFDARTQATMTGTAATASGELPA